MYRVLLVDFSHKTLFLYKLDWILDTTKARQWRFTDHIIQLEHTDELNTCMEEIINWKTKRCSGEWGKKSRWVWVGIMEGGIRGWNGWFVSCVTCGARIWKLNWTKTINHKNKQSGKYIITSVYISSYHIHTDAPVVATPLVTLLYNGPLFQIFDKLCHSKHFNYPPVEPLFIYCGWAE